MRARSDVLRTLFVVSTLAIAALIAAYAFVPSGVAYDENGDAAAAVFRSDADGASKTLIQLDPRTLDDVGQGDTLPVRPETVLYSSDGKVIAGVDDEDHLLVRTGSSEIRMKTEWAEVRSGNFSTSGPGWPIAFNKDASKLLVQIPAASVGWWKVFDAATGEALIEIREDPTWSSTGIVQVDALNWKLYYLRESDVSVATQESTVPAELVGYDLNTGTEIGRTQLTAVEMGSWEGDLDSDPNGYMPIFYNYIPGFAVSPDGSELAIVHAVDDGITVVDTATFTVSRTISMHDKTSLLGKVFAFIAPQQAEAKYNEGQGRMAFYAADGEHLYVSTNLQIIDGEEQTYIGHGLSVISLDDGEIQSETLDGVTVDHVTELPDGSIFVTGLDYSPEYRDTAAFTIARLDPGANDVEAERTFVNEYVSFVIVPST
jgi:hypothetical protein